MHAVAIYTLEGNLVKILKGFSNMVSRCSYNPDGTILAALSLDKTINLFDKEGNLFRSITGYSGYEKSMFFSRDGKLITTTGFSGIKITNINGILLKNIPFKQGLNAVSPNLEIVVHNTWSNEDFNLAISTFDNKLISELKGLSAVCTNFVIAPNNKHILATLQNGLLAIWNYENGGAAFLASKDKDWLMFTKDGYFASSQNGSKIVAMVKGMEAYSIDQFALRYNRPDLILKRLALGSPEQINYYHHLYKKRLEKRGISEDQLVSDSHVPEVKILETKTNGKLVSITFKLKDAKYNLKSYQIFVNDVPIFSGIGKAVSGKQYTSTEKVQLTKGDNKIEVSCVNNKGAESFRALTYAAYTAEVTQDLYFIGFGVSEYRDKALNLKYAHQDVLDLEELFKSYKGYYREVYTKIFLNQSATVENVKNAKSLLKNATVDDTFILFIAGHGVHDHDEEATYYYITHETDLNNLSNTAVSFEMVENILRDIPPRNKLFFMDTCESGEFQKDTVGFYTATAKSCQIRPRAIRSLMVTGKGTNPVKNTIFHVKRDFLLNKDRYIYSDIFRRSGAIVFSSSGGGEFSYENDEFKNGLFTEQIINILKDKKSDLDNDQKISTDEMRQLVTLSVSKLSNHLQNPTVDRDNIYQKFYFPFPKTSGFGFFD